MPTISPIPMQCAPMTFVGLKIRTNNAHEMHRDTAKIGPLWAQAQRQNLFATIPQRLDDKTPIAVYTDYESDHTGDYSFLVGAGVAGLEHVPNTLTTLSIPAGRYLVFTAQGAFPAAVINAWIQIWAYFSAQSTYIRRYSVDFEHYIAADTVAIHIGIED